MSDGFPDNDRDLNARLDQAVPPHTRTLGKPDTDPLTRLAQRLAQGPDVLFSEPALDRIETRLNAQMDTMALYSTSSVPRRRRVRFGRLARQAAAAALVLILVIATVTQAAAATLPGDRLYPVKRAVEDIRMTLVTKDGEAALRLMLAERRVNEFEALLERGRVYPRALEEANDEMSRALDLVSAGNGDWADVDLRFRSLMVRETFLLDQATRRANTAEQVHLDAVAASMVMIEQRIETLDPELPLAIPDISPTLAPTRLSTTPPTAYASLTPTYTLTLTATATPSVTPTPTFTPSPTMSPTASPTVMPMRHTPTSAGGPGSDAGAGPNSNPTPAQGGESPSEGGNPEGGSSGQDGSPPQGKGK